MQTAWNYPIHIITRRTLKDLAADLMGPLNHPDIHYIVIVDYYSWFYEVEVMQSTTTEKIIDCLADGFCLHGLPITIK